MTTEENSIMITRILDCIGEIEKQDDNIIKVLKKATDTIIVLTDRVVHLERMMGIRK